MKHQPFEDWLLNDKPITVDEKRELDLHLRACGYCTVLAETGMALKSVKMVAPAPGFTSRFVVRLAERKLVEHRHNVWGAMLFTLGGLALLLWLASPYLATFFASPAASISTLVEWGVFFITTLRAVIEAGSVLLRVVPGFISPFMWMVIVSGIAGVSLLWSVSIWRFVRVPQGV